MGVGLNLPMWQIVVWCISDLCDLSEKSIFNFHISASLSSFSWKCAHYNYKGNLSGTYKTLALLTFPEELIKFQTWIKSGFCRLRCEELGVLSVCLPPTEPVLWFLRDRALYLECVRVALCFWRTRWAASGPAVRRSSGPAAASQRPHSRCAPRHCLSVRALKHVLPSPRTRPSAARTNARWFNRMGSSANFTQMSNVATCRWACTSVYKA